MGRWCAGLRPISSGAESNGQMKQHVNSKSLCTNSVLFQTIHDLLHEVSCRTYLVSNLSKQRMCLMRMCFFFLMEDGNSGKERGVKTSSRLGYRNAAAGGARFHSSCEHGGVVIPYKAAFTACMMAEETYRITLTCVYCLLYRDGNRSPSSVCVVTTADLLTWCEEVHPNICDYWDETSVLVHQHGTVGISTVSGDWHGMNPHAACL